MCRLFSRRGPKAKKEGGDLLRSARQVKVGRSPKIGVAEIGDAIGEVEH